MKKIKSKLSKYIFLLIIVASIPAIWALLPKGFYGASDDIHIAWLYELHETIKISQFPPRFVPDLSFGFGYPIFNFVFPLPFYLAEIFHLLGFSLVGSIKLVFLVSVPVSLFLMYKLAREFMSEELSLAAGIVYVYTPYRATDIYVRGAIGEILSFAILPLVLLAFVKLVKASSLNKVSYRFIAIGGISITLLILCHNIVSYMFFPAILLFVFLSVVFLKSARKLILVQTIIALFLGLFGSIFFWLPALVDSSLMKYDTVFNFWDHYPSLRQLITPYFGYGGSLPGPYDGMSFFIGVMNLILVVLGVLYLIGRWRQIDDLGRVVLVWLTIVFFTSVFMMNHRSLFIWNSIPLLPYFQFPWRLLTLTTFVTPLFLIIFKDFRKRRVLALIIILFSILVNFKSFKPQDFLGREDNYFIERYIPVPYPSGSYIETKEEYLRLPKSSIERPDKLYPRFFTSDSRVSLEFREVNSLKASANVETKVKASVSYNKYYFPGWVGKIDGNVLPLSAGRPFGQIVFEVPEGKHFVEIEFTESRVKLMLDIISVVVFTTLVLMAIKPKIFAFLPIKI